MPTCSRTTSPTAAGSAGTTVLSGATAQAAGGGWPLEPMGDCLVKGRTAPVVAYRLPPDAGEAPAPGELPAEAPAALGTR
jgi:class 3 adenylate cyclase